MAQAQPCQSTRRTLQARLTRLLMRQAEAVATRDTFDPGRTEWPRGSDRYTLRQHRAMRALYDLRQAISRAYELADQRGWRLEPELGVEFEPPPLRDDQAERWTFEDQWLEIRPDAGRTHRLTLSTGDSWLEPGACHAPDSLATRRIELMRDGWEHAYFGPCSSDPVEPTEPEPTKRAPVFCLAAYREYVALAEPPGSDFTPHQHATAHGLALLRAFNAYRERVTW